MIRLHQEIKIVIKKIIKYNSVTFPINNNYNRIDSYTNKNPLIIK